MATKIAHTEYVGDIISSSTASAYANAVIGQSNSTYPQLQINPGNLILFPWLSIIAGNYIHYEFDELVLEFQSTSATALNSTNTQLGIICGRFELNPTIPVDNSLLTLLNTHGHMKRQTYESFSIRFPPTGKLLVRTQQGNATNNWGLSDNQDIRQYDAGWVNFATSGLQGTSVNCGQVHVHYVVSFYRPYYNIIANPRIIGSFYGQVTGTNVVTTSAVFPGGFFTSGGVFSDDGINGSNATMPMTGIAANTRLAFPTGLTYGYFLITYYLRGATAAAAACSFTAANLIPTNCALIREWANGTGDSVDSGSAVMGPQNALAGGNNIIWQIIVLVTGAGARLDQNGTNFMNPIPTGGQWAILTVTQIDGSMVAYARD